MSKKPNKKVVISEDQREKEQLQIMKKLDTTDLKDEIYQLRQQLTYLIKQKAKIETEMGKGNDKYMKESFQIEKTIKIQEEELTDLENNYKLLKNTFEEARKKNKFEWEGELEQLAKKKSQEKEITLKNLTQMTKKIEYLKQFKVREVEYINTLDRLKDREQTNRAHQTKDIEKIVQQHESKRKDIKETVTKEIENIKELQVNKLEQKMNRQQQIKRENEIIQEEIALCESEKLILEKEYQQLLQENQNNKGNSIGSQLEGQASETYERSLRVIKLENKLVKLKEFLQQEVTRLDAEYSKDENTFEETKKEMEQKLQKLEGWLKLKDKDHKKMRACSQMVLNQRSNLECYLLQVFHEHSQLDYKDASNINQILRYLFIKINSKKPPVSYKDYLLSTEQSQISKKSINT